MHRVSLLVLLAACVSTKEADVLQEILDASFTVTAPEGLTTCADAPVVVSGTIDARYAGQELGSRVTVDGETSERPLAIDAQGRWSVDISEEAVCELGDDDCLIEVTVYVETSDVVNDEVLATSGQTTVTITQGAELFYADADDDGFGDDVAERLCAGADGPPAGYVRNATDCDDTDPLVHPSATEICNGVDDNCDDAVDEGLDFTDWYPDADADTYGDDSAAAVATCSGEPPAPTGWVTDATDCNDNADTTHPGAAEICDGGEDNDCDGLADDLDPEGPDSQLTYYLDQDDDGFYDENGLSSCAEPVGVDFVTYDPGGLGDCDDRPGPGDDVNPAATEVCGDGIDNNCNGAQDDDEPGGLLMTQVFATDGDGDGYIPYTYKLIEACDAPPYTTLFDKAFLGDCDDADPAANPADADYDGNSTCDPSPDCDDSDPYRHAHDVDGDGVSLCDPDPDCNDELSNIGPTSPEVLGDGIDNDCDGFEACYLDQDNDTWGDLRDDDAILAPPMGSDDNGALCNSTVGFSSRTGDCVDTNDQVNPDPTRQEICGDGLDNNCNELEDDDDGNVDLSTTVEWMYDDDGDGNPLDATTVESCGPPDPSYVLYDPLAPIDCNDGDGTANYNDDDSDGSTTCDATPDCADDDNTRFPLALEGVNDGVDQDCDGLELCHEDVDLDGYGNELGDTVAVATLDCSAAGASAEANDCNDDPFSGGADINVGTPEISADGTDQDCDGYDACHADADGDGEGNQEGTVVPQGALLTSGQSCTDLGRGVSANTLDCDDNDNAVNTVATEGVADGVDQDCDGFELCYVDGDLDNFTLATPSETAPVSVSVDCDANPGFAASATAEEDCDDGDPVQFPGSEIYCNGTVEGCGRTHDQIARVDGGTAIQPDGDASAQIATAVASAASTVEICNDVTAEASLTLDRSLSIMGGTNVVLEAVSAPVLMVSNDATVSVSDLTIQNRSNSYLHSGDGGLVQVSGASTELTLTNVDLEGGRATGSGGAMAITEGDVIWVGGDCNAPFGNNSATHGGCAYQAAGSLDWSDGTCYRHSVSGDGGCLYVADGLTTLDQLDITDNVASTGGAIRLDARLDWIDGSCENNTSTDFGGGCLRATGLAQAALGYVGPDLVNPGPDFSGNSASLSRGNDILTSGEVHLVGGTLVSAGDAAEDVYVESTGLTCWTETLQLTAPYVVAMFNDTADLGVGEKFCDGATGCGLNYTCDGNF